MATFREAIEHMLAGGLARDRDGDEWRFTDRFEVRTVAAPDRWETASLSMEYGPLQVLRDRPAPATLAEALEAAGHDASLVRRAKWAKWCNMKDSGISAAAEASCTDWLVLRLRDGAWVSPNGVVPCEEEPCEEEPCE
jgi:hypothetical protein